MRSLRIAGVALACTLLFAGTAVAQGRSRGVVRGNGDGQKVWNQGRTPNAGVWGRSQRQVWQQDGRRNQRIEQNQRMQRNRNRGGIWYGNQGGFSGRQSGIRPPGWNQGRKAGWGNCNMPPGLAMLNGYRCGPNVGIVGRGDRDWRDNGNWVGNEGTWSDWRNDGRFRDRDWEDRFDD